MDPVPAHPYVDRPPRSRWRAAVSERPAGELSDWHVPRWPVAGAAVATAGSCFAQHLTRTLRRTTCEFVDAEPAPRWLPAELRQAYGYEVYSARYGNVYTARQLRQLLQRATGDLVPAESVWQHGDGVVDPFRPALEPEPFADVAELERSREAHLEAVLEMVRRADVFLFTLGLTETWASAVDGAVFPLAPGVAGGRYDPARHRFLDLTFFEVLEDLEAAMQLAREIRPGLRFLFTVSPVSMAATATDQHVAVASSGNKALLRTVCGELARRHDFVDYFPSFEMIASPAVRSRHYAEDARKVRPEGVTEVMRQFVAAYGLQLRDGEAAVPAAEDDEGACEEELLAAAAAARRA